MADPQLSGFQGEFNETYPKLSGFQGEFRRTYPLLSGLQAEFNEAYPKLSGFAADMEGGNILHGDCPANVRVVVDPTDTALGDVQYDEYLRLGSQALGDITFDTKVRRVP